MQISRNWSIGAGALALIASVGIAASADNGGEQRLGTHGGDVTKTERNQFEVVCGVHGLSVFVADEAGRPLDASKLGARATFYHPNSPKPWFERSLRVVPASQTRATSVLGLDIDLSRLPAKGVKVTLQITGLPDPDETNAEITVPFEVRSRPSVSRAITYSKATNADRGAIAAQRVCKVSGEDLFSMGGPVKVSRGDKSIFLCCMGCLRTIQANPDRYFGPLAAAGSTK